MKYIEDIRLVVIGNNTAEIWVEANGEEENICEYEFEYDLSDLFTNEKKYERAYNEVLDNVVHKRGFFLCGENLG